MEPASDGSRRYPDDFRATLDPETEIPVWFWKIIDDGQQNQERFEAICHGLPRDVLFEFIRHYRDFASYFGEPPFCYSLKCGCGENSKEDLAFWVISQGKEFALHLWNYPDEWGDLVYRYIFESRETSRRMGETSYEFIAEGVWTERFGEDYPR